MTIHLRKLTHHPAKLLCFFVLVGCQSFSQTTTLTVPLSKTQSMKLPQKLFPPKHVSQLLTLTQGKQRKVFQIVLRQTAFKGLKLAAFGLLGTPVFQLSYGNCENKALGCETHLEVSPKSAPRALALRVLRDLYLIHGVSEDIKQRLPAPLRIYTSLQERYLSLQGRKILAIKYFNEDSWKGPIAYENFEENYRLKIKNLPIETLSESQ